MLSLGAALFLFAWFVFVIRGGLKSWFDADDLMNLHYYWSRPWSALLKANLTFWSTYYRPGGGLFYRPIYALWGFHPLPFRIAALLFLCLNFWLLALVVRQLTGSRWAALLALLLLGINPSFSAAYADTGNIYDVLAYTFFWGAFALYVRIRQAGRIPGWGSLALLVCLFVTALNSKELSVSLPVAIGLYELVWHPPADWRPAVLWRWLSNEGRLTVIGGLIDIVYILGKRYGPNSLWLEPAYRPHYSAGAYIPALAHFLRELIYKPVTISTVKMAVILVAMILVAALSRRRCLIWALGFILISVLPLAFIPLRGGAAYMIPSLGWAVYVSGLADWLVEKATVHRVTLRAPAQALLLVLLFVVLAPWQRRWISMHIKAARDMQSRFRGYQDQIHALIPVPRKGARMLLLSDAGGYDDFDVYFLIRLYYGEPSLEPERMFVWKQRNVQVDPAKYDYVLDWVDGKFVLVGHK